jgi:hypothetical protein
VIRRVNRAAARDIKPPISPVGPGSGAAGAKKSA